MADEDAVEGDRLTAGERGERKARFGAYYDAINREINGSTLKDWALFLNFGYCAGDSPGDAVVGIPRHFPNRNSAQLILEVIGDSPIAGMDVLDVGCGRGGLLALLDLFYAPKSLTGLDLSHEAVTFSKRSNSGAKFSFEQGDAENLPFADGRFDVVTNVESSHSYPDIRMFYSEVHRVLKPAGRFLYTDALSMDGWRTARTSLGRLGFAITRDREITKNVLLSREEAAAHSARVDARNLPGVDTVQVRDFLNVADSFFLEKMRDGAYQYRILSLNRLPM
jgi:SAM-dependent methyltransferase